MLFRILSLFYAAIDFAFWCFERAVDFVEWIWYAAGERVRIVAHHLGIFLSGVVSILVPKRVVMFLMDKRLAIHNKTIGQLEQAEAGDEAAVPTWWQVVGGYVFFPFWLLLSGFLVAVDFATLWFYTRDPKKLNRAVPTMLLIMPLGVALLLSLQYSNAQKIAHYKDALTEAEATEDLDAVVLLQTKLQQLGYARSEVAAFNEAMDFAEQKEYDKAYEQLKEFAPTDQHGMLEAHLWVASAIIDGLIESHMDQDARLKLVETHTDHALALQPENELGRRLRLELQLRKGKLAELLDEIDALSRNFPELHATAVHGFRQQGEMVKARFHARRAIQYYERLLLPVIDPPNALSDPQADPADDNAVPVTDDSETDADADDGVDEKDLALDREDLADDVEDLEREEQTQDSVRNYAEANSNPDEPIAAPDSDSLTENGYLRLAEAFNVIDDSHSELRLLIEAAKRWPDNAALQKVLKNALEYRVRAGALSERGIERWFEALAQRDPANLTLLRRLAEGILFEDERMERINDELLAKGLFTARSFEFLGELFLINGSYDHAIRNFEKAIAMNTDSSFVWNNLAWLLTNDDFLDMDRALDAVNRAIAMNPDPRFYETRGQIHLQLSNWDAAISDLQRALNGAVPDMNAVHRSLAKAFKELGDEERSAAHALLAKRVVTD